jgi:hypothetical protein
MAPTVVPALALSRRARLDLSRILSGFQAATYHAQTRLTYVTALDTSPLSSPSTHVALANGFLGHAVEKRIPTVDPPLVAHRQRASSTAKSPCSVLF